MIGQTIERLLNGAYPDPDGGPPLRVATKSVVIAETLEGSEAELVQALGFGRRLAVVSDRTTHEILGARVERALRARGKVESLVLADRPHADMANVENLRRGSARADALVAVGSGTVIDLSKYAAACDGKPWAVFATAASMNGHTSATAAITVDGHKRSLEAVAATGVFMDLRILAAAPSRLIRSGLGDSLCRATAQADWLLAHLLRDEPYRSAPFALLAEDEAALLAEPEALIKGDVEAVGRLARTLVLSGFGMTICGSSRPASQGEHLISHYLDMRRPAGTPEALHGEQVGVTTLTMARLQERILAAPPPRVAATRVNEADLVAHFGRDVGAACWREFAGKRLDEEAAEALNRRMEAEWEDIRTRIATVLRPARELEEVLRRAGAPTAPGDLRLPRPFYREAVRHAREIRDRYTFLDLAGDAGMFDGPDVL